MNIRCLSGGRESEFFPEVGSNVFVKPDWLCVQLIKLADRRYCGIGKAYPVSAVLSCWVEYIFLIEFSMFADMGGTNVLCGGWIG